LRFHGTLVRPLADQADRDGDRIDPAGLRFGDGEHIVFAGGNFRVPEDVLGHGKLSRAADGSIGPDPGAEHDMIRAWTLGFPPGYEKAIRIVGNAKAPGGYVFRTRDAAVEYAASHVEAERYAPYEIVLPGTYEEAVTTDYLAAAAARHAWHMSEPGAVLHMDACGICAPHEVTLDCELLVIAAPFVNPDLRPCPDHVVLSSCPGPCTAS
jgi:hypothetical protein